MWGVQGEAGEDKVKVTGVYLMAVFRWLMRGYQK